MQDKGVSFTDHRDAPQRRKRGYAKIFASTSDGDNLFASDSGIQTSRGENLIGQSGSNSTGETFELSLANEKVNLTLREKRNFDKVLHKIQTNPQYASVSLQQKEEAAAYMVVKQLMKKKHFTYTFSRATGPPREGVPTPKKEIEVKFIIAEVGNTAIRQLVSPVLDLISKGPLFGLFHSAISVGDKIIEWNDNSLIVPRAVGGTHIVFATHVCKFSEEEIDEKIEIIMNQIIEWNVKKTYDNMKNNCQVFVQEMFTALDIPLEFGGAVGNYIAKTIRKGNCAAKIVLSEELATICQKKKGMKVMFKSHTELDQFAHLLKTNHPDYFESPDGKDVLELLKAFDRAFWFKHLKEKKMLHQKQLKKLSEVNEPCHLCIFGDPLMHSMAV
jgi:hypothetical protein